MPPLISLPRYGRYVARLLWATGITAAVVFTVAAAGGPGDTRSPGYEALYVCLFLIPGALCMIRSLLVAEQRMAWAAFGVAMWCWAAGSGYWFAVTQHAASPAYPSWSDAMWLGFYGFSLVGVMALMRSGLTRVRRSLWLDVAVGALAIATIGSALLVDPIVASTGGSLSAVAVNLAYPLFDLVVVSAVLAVFVITNWRPGRVWVMLGATWVAQVVVDTVYLDQVARGTYVVGGLVDALWPPLMLLTALAAWQRPAIVRREWVPGPVGLVVTLAFASVGLLVTTADHWTDIGDVAFLLATATMLLAFVRAVTTFGELKALARGKGLLVAHERILNAAGDGIMGIDADGRLTFANPAAIRMVGYRSDELIARDLHDLLHHTKADGTPYPRRECPVQTSLSDGSVHHSDADVYWRKDGTSFPVDFTSTPIAGFRAAGAVVVFRDVTERREVERVKEEFMSVVSHELRTPLTSISGSLRLLDSGVLGSLPEQGQRMLGIAVKNTDRLVRLINDILDVKRIGAAPASPRRAVCDAADLVARAVASAQPMAADAGVAIDGRRQLCAA